MQYLNWLIISVRIQSVAKMVFVKLISITLLLIGCYEEFLHMHGHIPDKILTMAPLILWHNLSVWTASLKRDFQQMFTITVLKVYHFIATSTIVLVTYTPHTGLATSLVTSPHFGLLIASKILAWRHGTLTVVFYDLYPWLSTVTLRSINQSRLLN